MALLHTQCTLNDVFVRFRVSGTIESEKQPFFILFIYVLINLLIWHTLIPSPLAGRVCRLKGSIHLSPVHALHFGLADWVSTPAPRLLKTIKSSWQRYLLTFSCLSWWESDTTWLKFLMSDMPLHKARCTLFSCFPLASFMSLSRISTCSFKRMTVLEAKKNTRKMKRWPS